MALVATFRIKIRQCKRGCGISNSMAVTTGMFDDRLVGRLLKQRLRLRRMDIVTIITSSRYWIATMTATELLLREEVTGLAENIFVFVQEARISCTVSRVTGLTAILERRMAIGAGIGFRIVA